MLRSSDDLEAKVIEIGFLPFFHNSVKGFSIQEMVDPRLWFSDEEGPWEWKGPVIRNMNCAYGKCSMAKPGMSVLNGYPTLPTTVGLFGRLTLWCRIFLWSH